MKENDSNLVSFKQLFKLEIHLVQASTALTKKYDGTLALEFSLRKQMPNLWFFGIKDEMWCLLFCRLGFFLETKKRTPKNGTKCVENETSHIFVVFMMHSKQSTNLILFMRLSLFFFFILLFHQNWLLFYFVRFIASKCQHTK